MSKPKRIVLYVLGGLVGLAILLAVSAVLVFRSHWFYEKVRTKLVSTIEEATGGRAEIGAYTLDWRKLEANVRGFELHGTEPANQPPLFHADNIQVGLKIISVWKRDIDLALLVVDRPQVNLIIDKNGNTNIPEPKIKKKSDTDAIETLLNLAIQHFEVRNGLIRFADQQIPLTARGDNLNAKFDYDFTGPRYRGDLSMRQLQLQTDTIKPVGLDVDLSTVLEKGHVQVTRSRFGLKESYLEAKGDVYDLNHPRAQFAMNSNLALPDLAPVAGLAPGSRGVVTLNGNVNYGSDGSLKANFSFNGNQIEARQGDTLIRGNVRGDGEVGSQGNGAYALNAKINGAPLTARVGTNNIEGSLEANGRFLYAAGKLTGDAKVNGQPLTIRSGTTTVRGNLTADAKVSYSQTDGYAVQAKVNGNRIDVRQPNLHLQDIQVNTNLTARPDLLDLRDLQLAALGGTFKGNVALRRGTDFSVQGNLDRLSLQRLTDLGLVQNTGYSAIVSGPVQASGSLAKGGVRGLVAQTRLNIVPGTGALPLRGLLDVRYDQRRGVVEVGNSNLNFPNSSIQVSGTLSQQLQVHFRSRNLRDFEPLLALASKEKPQPLPITLRDGVAQFDGTVTGALEDPRIAGTVLLTNFVLQERQFDRLDATLDAAKTGVNVPTLSLRQGPAVLQAKASVGLTEWKFTDNSMINASANLQSAPLARLLAQNGQQLPVDGLVSASAEAQGTLKTLTANAKLSIDNARGYGEAFDRVQAQASYKAGTVDIASGSLTMGTARMTLAANYQHPSGDFQNGRIRFNLSSNDFTLGQFKTVQNLRPGLQGQAGLSLVGEADIRKGETLLRVLNGRIGLERIALNNQAVGNFVVTAQTTGETLNVRANGDLRGSTIAGNAQIRLEGDYPGSGQLQISPLTFSKVQDLLTAVGSATEVPVDGTIQARVQFSGPLKNPDDLRARLEIPAIEIRPSQGGRMRLGEQDITIRNVQPVVITLTGKSVNVESARFTGRDSDLTLAGTLSLDPKQQWDLRANGALNLTILKAFTTDIETGGKATLNATVRGTLNSPQVNGRLELANASFGLLNSDITTGLDNANGAINFFNNRANIERLSAKVGGGDVSVSGYVSYGNGEMVYRLQAVADQVRYRQQGISITVDANLNLGGTSASSLLAGLVTIRRASFNQRTDFGGLLASAAKPVPSAPSPNSILRNMRLDVRVESVPNLQFNTSLTSNIQTEVDLRVKGTADKPVVLNTITVNQGEITFFGTKYTINRGLIGFYNPTKIEPVLDLDLSTIARGIEVTINFSGPITKLNVSYRSDPPLQSGDIIALLAVGRDPNANPALASSQTVSTTNVFQTGANSLIGQAVAAPVSNRLQRLFGVSKLKIDPQLTGIDAIPQARLTIEQQVSQVVTITFIQNLTNAQNTSFRLQYDLNKNFSIIAVRDENGLLGADLQYRRRLK